MQLTEKYKSRLDLIRQNPSLLTAYRFDKKLPSSNHFERLRLNIALYNDLQTTDYDIAEFLFKEEVSWRKDTEEGEADNLYFSAFVLTLFKRPEVVWLFLDTKTIDFDSSIGFDGEYLLAAGIEATYRYLDTADNPHKDELLKYIGETPVTCIYTQEEIDDWAKSTRAYFQCFSYPVTDELDFLHATHEKELFLQKLPEWIHQPRTWNYEELELFNTYAKFSGDKSLQVRAAELTVEKSGPEFPSDIHKLQLAALYIDTGQYGKAFDLLKSIPGSSDNKNIIRDCIEQLCKIVLSNAEIAPDIPVGSIQIIREQQRRYGHFSPRVDNLIKEAATIMTDHKPAASQNRLAGSRTKSEAGSLWTRLKQWFRPTKKRGQ